MIQLPLINGKITVLHIKAELVYNKIKQLYKLKIQVTDTPYKI